MHPPVAELLSVIERWAYCRCVLTRTPTDPCACYQVRVNGQMQWTCNNPVKELEELTPRDKAERRKQRRRNGK